MKVLIYGFGWSGKAILELCESMGCDCCVIDDSLDISNFNDTRFITYEMLENKILNGNIFDLYWIAVSGKPEITFKIQNKLLLCGGGGKISKNSICSIVLDGYHRKYLKTIKIKYSTETFIASLLENTFVWKDILEAYKETKRTNLQKDFQRYKAINTQCEDLSIFAKIFKYGTRNSALMYYPGITLPIDLNKKDKNFFFRHPVDFQGLKQRKRQIVALFGPSTIQESYYSDDSETLAFKLQELENVHKNPKIILNFGITGFTLYEQFLLYSSLIYSLKPEIVVTVFFGVDILSGKVSCEMLLEQHAIFYGGSLLEKDYRDMTQSVAPMRYQFLQTEEKPVLNNDEILLQALQMRLSQFNAMVTSYGGKFYPILNPLLFCKKEWSKEEKESHLATFQNFVNIGYEDDLQITELMKTFKTIPRDFMLYDGNDALRDSKETLFSDFIHLTPKGNEKFAQYIKSLVC